MNHGFRQYDQLWCNFIPDTGLMILVRVPTWAEPIHSSGGFTSGSQWHPQPLAIFAVSLLYKSVGEFDVTFVRRATTPSTGMVLEKMTKAIEDLLQRLSSTDWSYRDLSIPTLTSSSHHICSLVLSLFVFRMILWTSRTTKGELVSRNSSLSIVSS
jgi:hypothetical protein